MATEWFSTRCHKTKPKALWPITKNTDNPVNQSKLEANICSWRKARENGCERVTIGLSKFMTYDWLNEKLKNAGLLFELNWKLLDNASCDCVDRCFGWDFIKLDVSWQNNIFLGAVLFRGSIETWKLGGNPCNKETAVWPIEWPYLSEVSRRTWRKRRHLLCGQSGWCVESYWGAGAD